MMVRILSILPGFVGLLCIVILLGSIVGISQEVVKNDIPIIPCSEDEEVGCRIAMTSADIEVPNAFKLLEIDVSINWDEPDRSWFGVINEYPDVCEPDSNGFKKATFNLDEYCGNADVKIRFVTDWGTLPTADPSFDSFMRVDDVAHTGWVCSSYKHLTLPPNREV